jgi:hypothetical protein
MDIDKESSPIETLSQEVIQKLVGKALLEVQSDSEKYFRLFSEGVGDEVSVAELAISAITKLKAVEVIILTTLKLIMNEHGVAGGSIGFLHCLCRDTTLILMLLNKLATPEDLLEVYEESEVSNALRVYSQDNGEAEITSTDLNELTKDLKEMLGKSREARTS